MGQERIPYMPEEKEWLERRQSKEADTSTEFVASSMKEVSDAMSRYSVTPSPEAILDIEGLSSDVDMVLAKALSKVEIDDPELKDISIDTEDGFAKAAQIAAAKASSAAKETSDEKTKTRLQEFADKVIAETSNTLSKYQLGKKALRLAPVAGLILGACGPVESATLDVNTATPEPTKTSEVVPVIPTEEPTEIPTQEPTSTQEASPASEVIHEREVGYSASEFVPKENIPVEFFEALDEDQITILTFSNGENVPFGILDQFTEDHRENEASLVHFFSGIYRGWVPIRDNKINIVFEIPLESGNSQYFLLAIDDNPGVYFSDNYLIRDGVIPEEGGREMDKKMLSFSELSEMFRNENLAGQQLIFGIQTEFWNPNNEKQAEYNNQMLEIVSNMQEGHITEVSLAWSTFPIRIFIPVQFLP